MSFYFEATPPGGNKITYGPFEKDSEADRCREAVLEDRPDWEVGEKFTESANYVNGLPRPYLNVPLSDGSTKEVWTDGTEKIIPAE